MPRRTAPLEVHLSPMEKFAIGNSLSFGPWKAEAPDGGPFGARRFTDQELEQHWRSWASLEPPPGRDQAWGPRHWAYRRFELGETADTAFMNCRKLQWRRDADAG